MGGSQLASQSSCQICNDSLHAALDCPWLYSACRICGGIRRVWKSRVATSFNKKFLRCQFQPSCKEFQWLEEAIRESVGKPPQQGSRCCFHCGEEGHFKNKCPKLQSPIKCLEAASTSKSMCPEDEEEEPSVHPGTPAKLVVTTTLGELASALQGFKLK